MILNNDYIIESIQYELYLFGKKMDDIMSDLCLNESEILYSHKLKFIGENNISDDLFVVQEGEFGDKVKTAVLGAQVTGRYDLIRPRLLKMVQNEKKISKLEYYQKDCAMGITQLQARMKNAPKQEKEIKEHIKWLKEIYRPAISARKRELRHKVSETGLYYNELSDDMTTCLETGRFDLIHNTLLDKVHECSSIEDLLFLQEDLSSGLSDLGAMTIKRPDIVNEINDHIDWLRTKYTASLNEKFNELNNEINESTMNDIMLIQEGAWENIKAVWKALVTKLKEIWNAFLNKILKRKEDYEEYLKTNKDVLLNNKYSGSKEFPKFWEKNNVFDKLVKQIPEFDFNKMKNSLSSDEAFIKEYFPDIYQQGKSYTDVAKALLYGDTAVIKDGQMPIKTMYEYCLNGHKLRQTALETSFKRVTSVAENFIKDIESNKIKINESNVTLERFFYSYLLEGVIYEGNLAKDANNDNNDDKQTNTNQNTDENKEQQDKQAESQKTTNDNNANIKAQNLARRFITICTNINAIMMKCCDDTYDTYISILKEHGSAHGAKSVYKKKEKQDTKATDNTKK